ncbi:WD40 repeat domain-containing protein [Noviherbaspirillum aridicola]|uniref:WD40 repeat protein n=1 Tax=Noviherbaspirillum aridicola TaxID=2849687 RepID=A0ABQ4PZW6_9BURK|nr:hypothetical protein [Noviherbaspirillum aridicola]GIZ50074.1 hypothetical protein NCCP691_00880 [Noviherbaspirillum aridicola]
MQAPASLKRSVHCARIARFMTAMLCGVVALMLVAPALAANAPVLTVDPATHTAAIRQLAVDPDEQLLVTASDDKTARLWEIATGRLLHTIHVPVGPEDTGRLYAAAISPQRRLALAGTTAARGGAQRIYLYDLVNMSFIRALSAGKGEIKRLQWSPDGQLLAAAQAGAPGFRIFTDEGEPVHEERLPADAWNLTLSQNGLLALPVSDGTVRLYGIAGRVELLATLKTDLPDPRGLQFSPDGSLLAVGYQSRKSADEVQVDVFDVLTQTLAKSFVFRDIEHGNLRNVAWQRDGGAIYAAGSGYRGKSDFLIKRIAWPDGAATDTRAAGNSITDLLPTADNRVLFSTVEPAWGVMQQGRAATVAPPRIAQFLEADLLTISEDARTVAWRFAPAERRFSFSVASRDLQAGERAATRAARTESRRIAVREWKNSYDVTVAGRAVEMAPTEISRAVALMPDDSGALLATSRSLRRLAADGSQKWKVQLPTEARAVNVSADGRLLVVAMADGTLRWRSTADGSLLLSLFPMRDGRWVLWNEEGYFDASPGAEQMIGWTVNRPEDGQADFFPLGRYGGKYRRPEVLGQAFSPARAGAR